MTRETRSSSLAANVVTFVLVIVAISVTLISLASLGGVFELARDQVASRQRVFREATAVEISVRLDAALRTMDLSAAEIIDPLAEDLDRDALSVQYESGSEFIDRLVILGVDGGVQAIYPSYLSPRSAQDLDVVIDPLGDTPTFQYLEDSGELWLLRGVEGPPGELAVAVRVRMGYLNALLNSFSADVDNMAMAVVRSDGSVVASSGVGPDVRIDTIEYSAPDEETHVGSTTAVDEFGQTMWGQYSSVGSYPGLDWHVVVLEPSNAVIAATASTLGPSVIALVAAGVISILLAGLFSRRLISPLGDLEARARDAVTGAYVRPIDTERTDELGRLVQAFNAVALRLNSLHDLSQLLASSSSVDQVLDGILSAMGHIVRTARVAVFLVDDSGEYISLVRSRGIDPTSELTLSIQDESWIVSVLDAAGPVVLEILPDEHLEAMGLPDTSPITVLAAPLLAGKELMGLVAVFDTSQRSFSQAESEMVKTFSAQAAIAVRNSRLFEVESRSRQEADVLRKIAEALANPAGLESALGGVETRAGQLLGVPTTSIAIVDRVGLSIPPAEDIPTERALLRAWGRAMIIGGTESVMTVVQRGDDPVVDQYLKLHDGGAALFVTVLQGGEPGAVLCFVSGARQRTFSERELALADSVGNQITLALENAYLFGQARARAINLETIFRISQAVSSSLQIKVVLNRVLDVVQKIFSADAVSLMTYNESTKMIETAMARGSVSSEMLRFETRPGVNVPGVVFQNGAPAKIDDMHEGAGVLSKAAVDHGLHSALAVPLLARGRSIGVLAIFAAEPSAFSEEDMSLLHTFASQAALAIDTADMYGREHSISSVLQTSILPGTLPEFPEIETGAIYRAAGDEAEIGGDYYDLFRARTGEIVVAIGDVAGKGVQAATKTSMIKYSIRGLAAAGLSAREIMAEVNRMVTESAQPNDIVTLWVGIYDPTSKKLSYSNGGHPPGLLYQKETGNVLRLEPTGPLLGAVAHAPYGEETVELSEEDTLLLYTDGVTEARRGNKFFGEGRVRRSLRYGGRPEEVISRLLAALDRFVSGPLRDDAAILAIRVRGEEVDSNVDPGGEA